MSREYEKLLADQEPRKSLEPWLFPGPLTASRSSEPRFPLDLQAGLGNSVVARSPDVAVLDPSALQANFGNNAVARHSDVTFPVVSKLSSRRSSARCAGFRRLQLQKMMLALKWSGLDRITVTVRQVPNSFMTVKRRYSLSSL